MTLKYTCGLTLELELTQEPKLELFIMRVKAGVVDHIWNNSGDKAHIKPKLELQASIEPNLVLKLTRGRN
jgi:hypothetical protein